MRWQGIALWLRLLRNMTLLFGALFVLNLPALVFCEQHAHLADMQCVPVSRVSRTPNRSSCPHACILLRCSSWCDESGMRVCAREFGA